MILHCCKKHKNGDFPSSKCATFVFLDVWTDVYTEAAQLASPMQYTLSKTSMLGSHDQVTTQISLRYQ